MREVRRAGRRPIALSSLLDAHCRRDGSSCRRAREHHDYVTPRSYPVMTNSSTTCHCGDPPARRPCGRDDLHHTGPSALRSVAALLPDLTALDSPVGQTVAVTWPGRAQSGRSHRRPRKRLRRATWSSHRLEPLHRFSFLRENVRGGNVLFDGWSRWAWNRLPKTTRSWRATSRSLGRQLGPREPMLHECQPLPLSSPAGRSVPERPVPRFVRRRRRCGSATACRNGYCSDGTNVVSCGPTGCANSCRDGACLDAWPDWHQSVLSPLPTGMQ